MKKVILILTAVLFISGSALADVTYDFDTDWDVDGMDLAEFAASPKTSDDFAGFASYFGTYIEQETGIHIEPGLHARVGEELFFDASSFDVDDKIHARYEWAFGDGLESGLHGGITVTHIYMIPGTYPVTLTVTDINNNSSMAEATVTITGEYPKLPPRPSFAPLLDLKFQDDLVDQSSNGLSVTSPGGTIDFADGVEGRALDLTRGNYIQVEDPTGALNGLSEFTISLWAKKAAYNTMGYLFHKYDTTKWSTVFQMRLDAPDGRFVRGYAGTEDGVGSATYYARNDDTAWHHYILTYDGEYIKVFVDGIEIAAQEHSGDVIDSFNDLFIGATHNGDQIFDGYIDEFKLYDKALSEKELFVSFELWHADFHGHIRQYIYAQIPGEITLNSENRLNVTLAGDDGYSEILADKTDLQAEEKFLLDHSILAADNYTLTAQLLDSSGIVLDEVVEKFSKSYPGIPDVGIDENNAIVVNGELFFPTSPCGLNDIYINEWEENKYINVLQIQGFWPQEMSPQIWEDYINVSDNLKSIGPTRWEGSNEREYWRNADIGMLEEYVTQTKDNDAMMIWHWGDEPDLHSDEYYCPATVIRSWTYKCHQLDPHHLVGTNFTGPSYSDNSIGWWISRRRRYANYYNAIEFGKGINPYNGVPVADVYSVDYYPVEWAAPHGRGASFAENASVLDNVKKETYNLVPITSWVETSDINETNYLRHPTPWPPSPAQLRMNIWQNVVHGSKGINWFHYHARTPPENFEVMAQFVDQITQLTPVVLGPEVDRAVTVDITGGDGRIDTMIREYNGETYLFAVRVSEIDEGNVVFQDLRDFQLADLSDWENGMSFSTGDQIRNNGNAYRAISDHTSTSSNEAGVGTDCAAFWETNNLTLEWVNGSKTITYYNYDLRDDMYDSLHINKKGETTYHRVREVTWDGTSGTLTLHSVYEGPTVTLDNCEVEDYDGAHTLPAPIQNYAVNAVFDIEGVTAGNVTVFEENRNISFNSQGKLEDSFAPYDVYIYVISP